MSGWRSAATIEARYSRLGLAAALGRPYDYPAACEELSAILRLAYSKLPKPLQSLLLADTLAAFRRLPEVQTTQAMSSAILLFQAADAALPKQKRTLAISEFKHAAVAHKRLCKAQYDGGLVQLPQDVIVDIFSFLDMRSLVTASLVCRRAWNLAGSDNMLWQSQYSRLFGKYDTCGSEEQTQDNNDVGLHQNIQNVDPMSGVCWKEAFKKKYWADPFTSKRVLCGHCASILWLSSITSENTHHCLKHEHQKRKIKPVSSDVVVKYLLLGQTAFMFSDSDSDSDSEPRTNGSVFWAYVDYSGTAED